MMQKLKFYICLAAVLLLGAQALTAQESAVSQSTNGRFGSDVDNYFGVNDWADVTLSKWFSFLLMDNINKTKIGSLPTDWQGGLALKLSKAYLGLYYSGQFNEGTQSIGSEEIIYYDNGTSVRTGPDFSNYWRTLPGNIATIDSFGADVINRKNYFGVLLGIGDHGIKLTVDENIKTVSVPYVYTSAEIDVEDATNVGLPYTIPEGTYGSFQARRGSITPQIQWGAAKDMTLGKITTRPSVFLAFAITYDDFEFNDLTHNGDRLDDIHDYSGNVLIPKLGIDSGSIGIWKGDWGAISAGAGDEFDFTVSGEGDGGAVAWNNKLYPYAKFDYTASQHFSLGAKLNIPIWVGWDGSDGTYFGVGARGSRTAIVKDLPTLGVGFQLKGGFFDKIIDKVGIFDKVNLNWGIKVNLPGYLYSGTYVYDDHESRADALVITKSNEHTWIRGDTAGWLQEVYGGVTFFITPKVLIDACIVGSHDAGGNPISGSIMISVKH